MYAFLFLVFLSIPINSINACSNETIYISSKKVEINDEDTESIIYAKTCIKAPAETVFQVLADYGNHENTMPNTKQSTILKKNRNYLFVHKQLSILTKEINIYMGVFLYPKNYKITWKTQKGFMKKNSGYWYLKPIDKNNTMLYYYIRSIPSDSLPDWVVNSLTDSKVRNLINAVRKASVK